MTNTHWQSDSNALEFLEPWGYTSLKLELPLTEVCEGFDEDKTGTWKRVILWVMER